MGYSASVFCYLLAAFCLAVALGKSLKFCGRPTPKPTSAGRNGSR